MASSTPRSTLRLPLAAVLSLLLSGVLLVVTRPGSAAPDGGRRVVGASASYAVGPRWSRTSAASVLYYADPSGRPVAGLSGAVVADAGYCAGLPTSNRGFAGLTPATGDDLEEATRAVALAWASGVSGRAPPAAEAAATRLGDDTPAVRVSLRVRTRPSADPCLARRVALDVVGFAGADGPHALVVVRDVDPLGVTDAEVEAVVQSLRSRT